MGIFMRRKFQAEGTINERPQVGGILHIVKRTTGVTCDWSEYMRERVSTVKSKG